MTLTRASRSMSVQRWLRTNDETQNVAPSHTK